MEDKRTIQVENNPIASPDSFRVTTPLMPWGGNWNGVRLRNTCALDSFATLLFFLQKENTQLRESLQNSRDPNVTKMVQAFKFYETSEWNSAKGQFIQMAPDHISTDGNWFGGVSDWLVLLRNSPIFSQNHCIEKVCPSCGISRLPKNSVALSDSYRTIQSALDAHVAGFRLPCAGVLNIDLTLEDPIEEASPCRQDAISKTLDFPAPSVLLLRVEMMHISDVAEIPREITHPRTKQSYTRYAMILGDDSHFVVYFDKGNGFQCYDGLLSTSLTLKNSIQNGYTVNMVCFVLS